MRLGPTLFSLVFHANSNLTVVGSPTYWFDSVSTTSGTVDSTFTMTPAGSLAPYTYLWTQTPVTGDGLITITSPTAATTALDYSRLLYTGAEVNITLTGTVTSLTGDTATVNINVQVIRDSGGGAPP